MPAATTRETFEIDSKASLSALRDVLSNLRDYAGTLDDIEDSSDAASKGSGRLSGVLSKLGGVAGTAVKAVAGLGAIGAGALVAGVGAGFKALNDINDAMADFSAQTGISGQDLEGYRGIVENVFKEGVVESVDAAAAAMAEIRSQLNLTGEDLEAATNNAITLSEVFDKDIGESTRAVRQMMTAFDDLEDSTQAFDLLTTAIQTTGDPADDLLDTFNEYGPVFSQMGFDARQMTSLLVSGLQSGAFNADKVADAVKEMGVRLSEGGDDVGAAFEQMGFDFERTSGLIASGQRQWSDYFPNILSGLRGIEDPLKRQQAGIAVFGTMWEDLGEEAILSLDAMGDSLGDVEGATEKAGDTIEKKLGVKWNKFTRTVTTSIAQAIEPFAGKLLDQLGPALEKGAAWIGEMLPQAMEFLVSVGQPVLEFIGNLLPVAIGLVRDAADWLIPKIQDIAAWLGEHVPQAAQTLQEIFGQVVAWIQENVIPTAEKIVNAFSDIVNFVVENWPKIQPVVEGVMNVIVGIIRTAASLIQGIIETLLALLRGDWSAAWEAAQDTARGVWDGIKNIISGAVDAISGILGILGGALRAPWEGLTGFVEGILDGAKAILESGLNTMIGFLNSLIDGYNSTLGRIPGAPHIDAFPPVSLAEGGIVSSPLLAVVGDRPDRVPEVVAPLSDLQGMLGGGLAGATINITVPIAPGGYSPEEAGQRAGDEFVRTLRAKGIRI